MHIGWVVPGFQGTAGESGIPALNGLARSIGEEHDLDVFTVRYPARSEQYCVPGARVQSFGEAQSSPSPLARRAASARRWVRVLAALTAAHRRTPFAVLHGFWATESGMLAVMAGRLLGVPVLVSCCGGELAAVRPAAYGSRLHDLERLQVALSLHGATCIGVGSDDLRARLLVRYPWLIRHTELLPLGYDPDMFTSGALDRKVQGRILCVASWSPVKGHALLLDAMRLLVQRGVKAHLLLVGERTDSTEARLALAQRGLRDHVELVGPVPQAEVAELLGTAEAAVIASWHEAQCLAVVEALACGVPVVSTAVGIARELLHDPRLGCCIASRSARALADAMERQLHAARECGEHAGAARRQAVTHLALPYVAHQFLHIYQRLAALHPGTCDTR